MPFQKGNKINLGKKVSEETKDKMRKNHADFSGKNHPKWKGGIKNVGGYIYIWKPEHPNATKAGYILRSRLVSEKILRRYLTMVEIIHHINSNTLDDKPKNLYLFENHGKHIGYHNSKKKPILKSNMP